MEQSDKFSNMFLREEQIPTDPYSLSSVKSLIPMYQEELQLSWFILLEGKFKNASHHFPRNKVLHFPLLSAFPCLQEDGLYNREDSESLPLRYS